MADDIGSSGEDPRDVARRRRNIGRRLREGQVRAAQSQTSGPPMTPSRQSMVPYQERLPAVRREGMSSVRVPQGAADMMRGAMQSPLARAMGAGRAAAGRAAAEVATRVGERLMRVGRSPATRMPGPDLGEGPAEPLRTMTPGYEEDMYAGSVAGRPAPRSQPVRRSAPRRNEDPEGSQAAADAERERQRIAYIRGVLEGGDIQPREPNLDERIGAAMDRGLGRIGLRRTNETGEGRASTGSLRGDLEALGRSLGFKKGGAVKPKVAMKKGGKAMMYREGGKVRQGMQSPKAQEARAEMAENVMKRSMPAEPKRRMRDMMSPEDRREYDAPLTTQERDRMRASGFKKGGMIKPMKYQEGGSVEETTPSRRSNRSLMERAVEGVRRDPILGPVARHVRRSADALMGGRRRHGGAGEYLKMKIREAAPAEPLDPFKLPPGRYINRNGEEVIVNIKKGGMVKAKAPAKKMAHGGKVHGPKKMMKGGMTSKPKKMMGGGRVMYAKGGMTRGCK